MSVFEILGKCTSSHWNVDYVSDGVISMFRLFLSTLVEMGFRSHDFNDEPKISFSSSVERSKLIILDLILGFCTYGISDTFSGNLEQIVSFSSTKYFEKWS